MNPGHGEDPPKSNKPIKMNNPSNDTNNFYSSRTKK